METKKKTGRTTPMATIIQHKKLPTKIRILTGTGQAVPLQRILKSA